MVSLTASPAKLLSSTAKWAVWKRLKKRRSLHTTKLDKIIQQWVRFVVQILPLQHKGNQQQPLLCCYFSPHPVHVGTWTDQFNHCSNLIPHFICLKTGFSFQIKSVHKLMWRHSWRNKHMWRARSQPSSHEDVWTGHHGAVTAQTPGEQVLFKIDSIQLLLNLIPKHFRPKTSGRVFNLILDRSSERVMKESNNDEELSSAWGPCLGLLTHHTWHQLPLRTFKQIKGSRCLNQDH